MPFGSVACTFSPTNFLAIAVCKTSQYEIRGKNHICSRLQNSPYFGVFKYKHVADFFTDFEKKPTVLQSTFAQSKRFPPEHNLPTRGKKSSEQAAFWHEVKVHCCLPTPFLHLNDSFIFLFMYLFEKYNFAFNLTFCNNNNIDTMIG